MFNKVGKGYQFLKTIVKPSGKKDKTKEYKFNLMQKKLKNQMNKLKGDK